MEKWNKQNAARELWMNPQARISNRQLAAIRCVHTYLQGIGYEMVGVPSDGDCFILAFLASYNNIGHKIPVLEAQSDQLRYLRELISGAIHNNASRAELVLQRGTWITCQEGEVLARILNIPIRTVTVNIGANSETGINDMICRRQPNGGWECVTWDVCDPKPASFIFIIDLGGHFVYARKLSTSTQTLNEEDQPPSKKRKTKNAKKSEEEEEEERDTEENEITSWRSSDLKDKVNRDFAQLRRFLENTKLPTLHLREKVEDLVKTPLSEKTSTIIIGVNGIGKSTFINTLLQLTMVDPASYFELNRNTERTPSSTTIYATQWNNQNGVKKESYDDRIHFLKAMENHWPSGGEVPQSAFMLPIKLPSQVNTTTACLVKMKYHPLAHVIVEYLDEKSLKELSFISCTLDQCSKLDEKYFEYLTDNAVPASASFEKASGIRLHPFVKEVMGKTFRYVGNGEDLMEDCKFVRNVLQRIIAPVQADDKDRDKFQRQRFALKKVTLYLPCAVLENLGCLVDTPGTDDADPLSIELQRTALSKATNVIVIAKGNIESQKGTLDLLKEEPSHFLNRLCDLANNSYHLAVIHVPERADVRGLNCKGLLSNPQGIEDWIKDADSETYDTLMRDIIQDQLRRRLEDSDMTKEEKMQWRVGIREKSARIMDNSVFVMSCLPMAFVSAITNMNMFQHFLNELHKHKEEESTEIEDEKTLLGRTRGHLLMGYLHFLGMERFKAASAPVRVEMQLVKEELQSTGGENYRNDKYDMKSLQKAITDKTEAPPKQKTKFKKQLYETFRLAGIRKTHDGFSSDYKRSVNRLLDNSMNMEQQGKIQFKIGNFLDIAVNNAITKSNAVGGRLNASVFNPVFAGGVRQYPFVRMLVKEISTAIDFNRLVADILNGPLVDVKKAVVEIAKEVFIKGLPISSTSELAAMLHKEIERRVMKTLDEERFLELRQKRKGAGFLGSKKGYTLANLEPGKIQVHYLDAHIKHVIRQKLTGLDPQLSIQEKKKFVENNLLEWTSEAIVAVRLSLAKRFQEQLYAFIDVLNHEKRTRQDSRAPLLHTLQTDVLSSVLRKYRRSSATQKKQIKQLCKHVDEAIEKLQANIIQNPSSNSEALATLGKQITLDLNFLMRRHFFATALPKYQVQATRNRILVPSADAPDYLKILQIGQVGAVPLCVQNIEAVDPKFLAKWGLTIEQDRQNSLNPMHSLIRALCQVTWEPDSHAFSDHSHFVVLCDYIHIHADPKRVSAMIYGENEQDKFAEVLQLLYKLKSQEEAALISSDLISKILTVVLHYWCKMRSTVVDVLYSRNIVRWCPSHQRDSLKRYCIAILDNEFHAVVEKKHSPSRPMNRQPSLTLPPLLPDETNVVLLLDTNALINLCSPTQSAWDTLLGKLILATGKTKGVVKILLPKCIEGELENISKKGPNDIRRIAWVALKKLIHAHDEEYVRAGISGYRVEQVHDDITKETNLDFMGLRSNNLQMDNDKQLVLNAKFVKLHDQRVSVFILSSDRGFNNAGDAKKYGFVVLGGRHGQEVQDLVSSWIRLTPTELVRTLLTLDPTSGKPQAVNTHKTTTRSRTSPRNTNKK